MHDTLATRVLGGSPLTVLVRLAVVSLLVGALMSWLGVDPADVFHDIEHGVVRLWANGFAALGDIGRTVVAGALVVLPVWVVMRMLRFGGLPRRVARDDLRGPGYPTDDVPRPARWSSAERVREERRF